MIGWVDHINLSNQPGTLALNTRTSGDPNTKTKLRTSWKKWYTKIWILSRPFKTYRYTEKILTDLTLPERLSKKGFLSCSNTGVKCCAIFMTIKSMFRKILRRRRTKLFTITKMLIYMSRMIIMIKLFWKWATLAINRRRSL